MGDQDQGQKTSINWGGLAKGILVGAAIVGGAYLISPATVTGLVEGIGKLGTQIGTQVAAWSGDATAKATLQAAEKAAEEAAKWQWYSYLNPINWASSALTGINDALGAGIGGLVTKVVGIVAVVKGVDYLTSEKREESPHHERYREQRESFAIREDMRKMQAVMIARMQAAGHEPAMALANQQGRA